MLDDLDMLRKSWLRSLRSKHKSAQTIKTYNNGVQSFLDFLAAPPEQELTGAEETPAELLARLPVADETDITRDHVAAFIGWVLSKNKPATALSRYNALHIWFGWMVEQPDINIDRHPMTGMARPVIPEEHPAIVPVDHIRKLLETCDQKTFKGLRDIAIIRLLADTGVRVGECAGLMVVDVLDGVRVPTVDLDTETVFVMGKGRRPRQVAFGAKTATALDRYLRARRKHPHKDLPDLWLRGNNQHRKIPLTTSGMRNMLTSRADLAGVPHIHPHLLRHTWADAMKRSGLDRGDLKHQGGWRTDSMVDRYGAAAATDRALRAHRRNSFGDDI